MEASTSNSGEELHQSIVAQEDLSDESENEDLTIDDSENEDWECPYCDEWRCICPNSFGKCSCPPNAAPLPSCVFYSPRIVSVWEDQRTVFESARSHWTVVDAESAAEVERTVEDNRKYFDEVLVKRPEWGAFFGRFEDLEVGAKIAEGGQAEIFAASSKSFKNPIYGGGDVGNLVAKVWKKEVRLRDLERQWPPQMLLKFAEGVWKWPFKNIYGGAFIRDGEFKNRFAFVMQRWWGDLRTWIDERMLKVLRSGRHGPPFNDIEQVLNLIIEALNDLRRMHEAGVLHRDIKASNVLLNSEGAWGVIVIDYECSVGLTGTGFWRAPEILEQLRQGVPWNKLVVTEKADIYSFGMLCYEIITGCIPFEDHARNDFSIVLRGERPELPHDLDPKLKEIVMECWEQNPQLRPTSSQIFERLRRLWHDQH